jgi:hypothetical protein
MVDTLEGIYSLNEFIYLLLMESLIIAITFLIWIRMLDVSEKKIRRMDAAEVGLVIAMAGYSMTDHITQ